jgi:hypothetical protein
MAMYLIEFKTNNGNSTEYATIAVGTIKELMETLMVLDNSDRVEHWEIINHKPSDFGWSDNDWNKRKDQPKPVSFIILESGVDFNASNLGNDEIYYLAVSDNWKILKDIRHYCLNPLSNELFRYTVEENGKIKRFTGSERITFTEIHAETGLIPLVENAENGKEWIIRKYLMINN